MPIEVFLSVHQLVDYLLRRGSIDSRVYNADTMAEGTRIHLRYQSIQDGTYQSEVPLECSFEYEEFIFHLQGRADGVIRTDGRIVIDEIKSTNDDLDHFHEVQGEWHLGQAICYAYMYAESFHLDEMGVRLTYISQTDGTKRIKDYVFSKQTLFQRVSDLIASYVRFYRLLSEHKERRKISSGALEFPFEDFRKGQREVSKYVYKVVSDGGLFLFEAPTGTGKTISTLYPSVKTFSEERNDKIFYLSAKAQAKTVAHQAMKLLVKKGLIAHSIVLASKEHMCQCEKQRCNPEDCPFAKDYYEKINAVIERMLMDEMCIDPDTVLRYALLYGVCPFECQLDLSLYCDVIICDYNYLFDPLVYLKRFFDASKTPYFALIDEAHNLSERTKDMFTIALETSKLVSLQKAFRKFRAVGMKRSLRKLISLMEELSQDAGEHTIVENDFPLALYNAADNLFASMQEILKEHGEYAEDEFGDVFRMIYRFNKIHDYLDESFVTYIEKTDDLRFFIRCVDASSRIQDTLQKIRGAVLFSATLTPMDYYIRTLGGDENTPYLRLPSPFEQSHLCLLVRSDISTRYKDRERSYQDIADSIRAVVGEKTGNYLVFFSSYQYLSNVLDRYPRREENIIVQAKEMKMKDREEFLASFRENPDHTTVGFAVLGGAFSEGIDLSSDRLIGAIIVGVGLPMVSFERDLIRKYYDAKGVNGFDYSYTNPGKNKVMQAAGRVIRSASDRGVVLLIDERFMQYGYRDLFRLEWSHYKRVRSTDEIRHHLNFFWKQNNLE